MWKDSDTNIDYLDFDYLIGAIKSIIDDDDLLPASIGVYGDWGSGKSSLMRMCREKIKDEKGTVCVYFNAWLYEDYDDVKTSMMKLILDKINSYAQENKSMKDETKDILFALYKSIDKFKLIKNGIKYGTDFLLTGGVTTVADIALNTATKMAGKEASELDIDKDNLLDKVRKELTHQDLCEDIHEFREKFGKLIEEANIKKLVVFIDELDRCNPNSIIDILEAIRLFLFAGKTAFIIGADNRHLNYAIKTKFRDIEGINMEIGDEYQEKLIQYPIHIPSMDNAETEFYIMNLLFQKHKEIDIKKLENGLSAERQKDFLGFRITFEIVKQIIGDADSDELKDDILLAQRLSPILFKGLSGNPRQCKRFLNTLDMRMQMAEMKHVSELKKDVLVKVMEVEYFKNPLFIKMMELASDEGSLKRELQSLENAVSRTTPKEASENNHEGTLTVWKKDPWVNEWASTEPNISDEDLKKYFYFMRSSSDGKFFVGGKRMSPDAVKTYEGFASGVDLNIRRSIGEMRDRTEQDSRLILQKLFEEMIKDTPISNNIFKGFIKCGMGNKVLENETIRYFDSLSGKVISNKLLPILGEFYKNCSDKNNCNEVFEKWKKENPSLKHFDEIVKN